MYTTRIMTMKQIWVILLRYVYIIIEGWDNRFVSHMFSLVLSWLPTIAYAMNFKLLNVSQYAMNSLIKTSSESEFKQMLS